MNDTPGWASPGSAPSDGQEPAAPAPAEPTGHPSPRADGPPEAAQPASTGQAPSTAPESSEPGPQAAAAEPAPQSPGPKWSKEQPPPAQWSAPSGPQGSGQAPPPPPAPAPGAGQGWGTHPSAGGPGTPGGWTGPVPPGGYGGPQPPHGQHGHPGWGGGWGAGWGGPPPAAKPGVIPLRPLGVGEILDGAVSTMRTYWRTVLGISLTVAVVTETLVVLLQGLVLQDAVSSSALGDTSATTDEQIDALRDSMISSGAIFLVTLVGTVIATALLTAVTSRAVLGKEVALGEAWRDARPRIPALFGLILLLLLIAVGIGGVGVLPGILLAVAGAGDAGAAIAVLGVLAAFVVIVWLFVRLSLASPALMLEKQGIRKAMSRSTKLVSGSWWRVFGIQLLAAIIANVISAIVVVPFAVVGALAGDGGFHGFVESGGDLGWTYLVISGIGSVIGSMITFPITAGVTVLLYIDQRIRREALDLDLARAAGVPGYAAPAPGPTPGS
ncbi:glycerophosphoryl diester phosphodiesterase membrane domain-containing protein [Streptomyces longwoodensis]|uniref:glycerophosphoryl diester phosphodiesterase membrane domain-containing protein n=1 Tax=Streptomyces longwoodensis TaxID=68231 RepID=UPI00225565B3|nr:glycerophosphoryl diester phosphodiesterase membrane domain-containing protein [Streptomyces longwoodensis]MCX4994049.1 glycerophosphoryl diester phosphodiesterase membrane domain-containing protein [Streptomyces longwoodensis]WTI46754.1 glycerophosphoryl diester phosphodiesterase membrane domain-containing protein [Streptomyces longwoodensis]WUC59529.1 glycerophosphoryl diester phosphodiesterase membrane domain-containing protein [Streptomyces longwoodensis]WUC73034.1 glycerophosphoryl dies